jgi:Ser/Thr protein kinase RdoA (MazF antagonist)
VAALAVDGVEELNGGHQSRVFRVVGGNGLLAVAKVLNATIVDRDELEVRLDVTAALADLDRRVCRPLLLGDQRVLDLTTADGQLHHVVCFEFAFGAEPDPARAVDASRMGAALSQLHASMSRLCAAPLPVVNALRSGPVDDEIAAGRHQILHGDFNASNLRDAGGVFRIFDFDDCGYGPPEFDVANALYMVLFDATTHGTVEIYKTFRRSFVDGYVGASGPFLHQESLDRFIDLRVRALAFWLDDVDNAPIGIRTAPSAWHATLRSFVTNYRPATH